MQRVGRSSGRLSDGCSDRFPGRFANGPAGRVGGRPSALGRAQQHEGRKNMFGFHSLYALYDDE